MSPPAWSQRVRNAWRSACGVRDETFGRAVLHVAAASSESRSLPSSSSCSSSAERAFRLHRRVAFLAELAGHMTGSAGPVDVALRIDAAKKMPDWPELLDVTT